jgi:mRNA interferase MazF
VTPPREPDPLVHGELVWARLAPATGREQDGHRPALVVASDPYLRTVTSLAVVVPLTSVDRGWPNHVRVRGAHRLPAPSWAMTEQVRTIDRSRITGRAGYADAATVREVGVYLGDFLGLG